MQLFYSPTLEGLGLNTLDAKESHHAVRVMRLRAGDAITLCNGRGLMCHGHVVEADERACLVQADEVVLQETATPRLHLAVAPTKNPSRMEWLAEKAVEVGIASLTLLQCDHSERTRQKTDRLERVVLSAMKQSLHATLPPVCGPVPFKEWLASCPKEADLLVAHCMPDSPRTPILSAMHPGNDAVVLIGPEGDFSTSEIEAAIECGFRPVSLGESRLRTETAALYAVVAFNLTKTIGQ